MALDRGAIQPEEAEKVVLGMKRQRGYYYTYGNTKLAIMSMLDLDLALSSPIEAQVNTIAAKLDGLMVRRKCETVTSSTKEQIVR